MTLGAVNKPLGVMVPALADHLTPVSLVLVTLASNCSLPLEATLGELGVIATVTVFCLEDWL